MVERGYMRKIQDIKGIIELGKGYQAGPIKVYKNCQVALWSLPWDSGANREKAAGDRSRL